MADKGASARIAGAAAFVSMADGGAGARIAGAAVRGTSDPARVILPATSKRNGYFAYFDNFLFSNSNFFSAKEYLF
jgi:hypothetical protein